MISARQFAEKAEKPYTTVIRWLQNGLIEGAEKLKLPDGRFVYEVPSNAKAPELVRGWVAGKKRSTTKTAAKKATNKKGN